MHVFVFPCFVPRVCVFDMCVCVVLLLYSVSCSRSFYNNAPPETGRWLGRERIMTMRVMFIMMMMVAINCLFVCFSVSFCFDRPSVGAYEI